MSVTDPAAAATAANQVVLPAGWSAGPAHETSALGPAGQIVQGVQVPITNINGTNSTVFIPYTILEQGAAAMQTVFDQRIAALSALPGLGS